MVHCSIDTHCLAFLSCLSCFLSKSGYMNQCCNVEQLHLAQIEQDVYTEYTCIIYTNLYSVFITSVGLPALAPIVIRDTHCANNLVRVCPHISQINISTFPIDVSWEPDQY